MKRYYNIFIVTTILLMGSSSLSAQCVDDATGAYTPYGGCATFLSTGGMDCDGQFGGIPIMDECPLSCSDGTQTCSDGVWDDASSTCTFGDSTGNTWHTETDCEYVCGGAAEVDGCAVCEGDNSPNTGVCDCAGVPNGDTIEDCAGVCDGDAEEDCAGYCDGSAVVDECDV